MPYTNNMKPDFQVVLTLIKKNNKEDPKFEFGNQLRIFKYKKMQNIFLKIALETFFKLKKLKILPLGYRLILILTLKKLLNVLRKINAKTDKRV